MVGNDTDSNFRYKYENTVGATVYVIGIFLSITIQRTSVYRIQQTLVYTLITLILKGAPHGGRPLVHTKTGMEVATELTVSGLLFRSITASPKPPMSSL